MRLSGTLVLALFCLVRSASAQEPPVQEQASGFSQLTTDRWCADSGTLCWNNRLAAGAGVRLVGEPRFGNVFSTGGDQFVAEGFSSLSLVGFEVNVFRSVAALHASVVVPGTITFDEKSEVFLQNRLVGGDREVDVEWGWNLGVALLDGSLFMGYGVLYLDERDFVNPRGDDPVDQYLFVSFQPLSSIRSIIKGVSPRGEEGSGQSARLSVAEEAPVEND